MKRSVVVAVASLVPLTLPVVASAQDPYVTLPPVVTLSSDAASITATITNPNAEYVRDGFTRTCDLWVGVRPPADPVRSVISLANQDPFNNPTHPTDTTHYPQAGQTVTLTMGNLVPGQYSLSGVCGQLSHRGGWLVSGKPGEQSSEIVNFEVRVGPEPEPEPAGSLVFGS